MDPISAIAGAVGSGFSAIGNIFTSKNNKQAAIAQANAQKYTEGQITLQEYIKLQGQEENNLSDKVNTILSSEKKTDYLPYILVAGIILLAIVAVAKKSKL